jgi:hypothetical protein
MKTLSSPLIGKSVPCTGRSQGSFAPSVLERDAYMEERRRDIFIIMAAQDLKLLISLSKSTLCKYSEHEMKPLVMV